MSDELIAALVSDLRPVRPLANPTRRAVRFGAVACGAVGAAVSLAGARQDLAARLRDAAFLGETALLLASFGAATWSALASCVPGAAWRGTRSWLMAALGAWLALIAARYALQPNVTAIGVGLACVRRMLLFGIVPACVLMLMLRRAAPLERGTSGFLACLSAGSLAVLGTRLLCAKEDALHVLFFHFTPLVALAVSGSLLGRRWLR